MTKRKNNDWMTSVPFKGPRAFPEDLAHIVAQRWNSVCAGDYAAPPCPPEKLLQEVLEVAYLTASAPEEDRFPKFNLVCFPKSQSDAGDPVGYRWKFIDSRPLSVGELRRLAPASDLRKSAIWLEWDDLAWQISGLIDLGTSWSRARAGLEYHYQLPSCLLVEIDRPGRLRIYQGQFHVASLADGTIDRPFGIDMHLSLHEPAHRGLSTMKDEIVRPEVEHPREFTGFEFIALWNTYAAIANSISLSGHGGALVIAPSGKELPKQFLKAKYPLNADALRTTFVNFMNSRHVMGDLMARSEGNEIISDEQFSHASLRSKDAFTELVEATRFVAQLARCDGAIAISDDLRLLGFGVEINADLKQGTSVTDVIHELSGEHRALDVEQFGMRHRSAIKLVSQQNDLRVLVVSQDGPISAVWFDKQQIFVRGGVSLVNMNIPWA